MNTFKWWNRDDHIPDWNGAMLSFSQHFFCSLFIWFCVFPLNQRGILIEVLWKGHPAIRRPSRINLSLVEEGTQTLQNLSRSSRPLICSLENPMKDIHPTTQATLGLGALLFQAVHICCHVDRARNRHASVLVIGSLRWIVKEIGFWIVRGGISLAGLIFSLLL